MNENAQVHSQLIDLRKKLGRGGAERRDDSSPIRGESSVSSPAFPHIELPPKPIEQLQEKQIEVKVIEGSLWADLPCHEDEAD